MSEVTYTPADYGDGITQATEHALGSSHGIAQATLLGFVLLGDDQTPRSGHAYPVVPASAAEVVSVAPPAGSAPWHFDMNIEDFYSGDMPDFTGKNEGLLRLEVDTLLPQDDAKDKRAAHLVKFKVQDFDYAGGFQSRGAFRNVRFTQYVTLRVTADEIDPNLKSVLSTVERVVDESGLAEVDVLKSIPYLDVGVKLTKSLARNVAFNKNDPIWAEQIILELDPITGSAALRSGIYFLISRTALLNQVTQGDKGQGEGPVALTYKDNALLVNDQQVRATHFRLAVRVREVVENAGVVS